MPKLGMPNQVPAGAILIDLVGHYEFSLESGTWLGIQSSLQDVVGH